MLTGELTRAVSPSALFKLRSKLFQEDYVELDNGIAVLHQSDAYSFECL